MGIGAGDTWDRTTLPLLLRQRLATLDSANNTTVLRGLQMQPLGLLHSSVAASAVAPATAATTDADVAPGASAAPLGPMGSGAPMNIPPACHELTSEGAVALELLGATSGVAPSQVQ